MANQLKYLSINTLIGAPYFQMSQPNRKKRSPRLTMDAMINTGRNGDQLIGDWGESGGKYDPKVVLVVNGADVFVLFVGKSGDNPEEEVGNSCKFATRGEP